SHVPTPPPTPAPSPPHTPLPTSPHPPLTTSHHPLPQPNPPQPQTSSRRYRPNHPVSHFSPQRHKLRKHFENKPHLYPVEPVSLNLQPSSSGEHPAHRNKNLRHQEINE